MSENIIITKLASLSLTIGVLLLLTVICIAGTVLEYDYAMRTIFTSVWFWAILTVLSLNLIACLIKSLPKQRTAIGKALFLLSHASVLLIMFGGVLGRGWGIQGHLSILEQEKSSAFADPDKMGRTFEQFDQNRSGLWEEEEIANWEKTTTAVSGWNLRAFDADKNKRISYKEWSGAMTEAPAAIRAPLDFQLPFEVFLDEFVTEHYPTTPRLYVEVNNTRIEESFEVKPGAVYHVKWTPYEIRIEPYPVQEVIPQKITVTVIKKNEVSSQEFTIDPLSDRQQQRNFFQELVITYYVEQEAMVKAWKSKVKVLENGKIMREDVISVNHPLDYQGFLLFQSSYGYDQVKRKMKTGLHAVKDPGVPFVYVGFGLISLSLFVKFCIVKPRGG